MSLAPLPPPAGRLAGLDVGRVAAAVAVVWLHTAGIGPQVAPLGVAGRFAVPFFTLLSAALIAERCTRGSSVGFAGFARTRILRLYGPFLFWTALYLALRLAKHALRPATPAPPVGPHLFVVGSAHHLWYLPFLLVVSLAVRLIAPALASARPVAAAACVAAGCAVALTPFTRPHNPADAGFVNQVNYLAILGWAALPAAFIGVAAGLYFRTLANALAGRPAVALAAVALAVALLTPGDDYPARVVRENLSGAAVFAACLALPVGKLVRTVAGWGQYAFGVYADHVAFILALEAARVRDRADFVFVDAVTIFGLATAASFALAAALARNRWTAWAVS